MANAQFFRLAECFLQARTVFDSIMLSRSFFRLRSGATGLEKGMAKPFFPLFFAFGLEKSMNRVYIKCYSVAG